MTDALKRSALERLVQLLKAPSLNTRRDAAEALLQLPEPAALKPLLQPLLTSPELGSQAWGAGLLHALGEPEAYAKWRGTVVSPESRRDAVGVAPFMKEPRAVRELLRLLGELTQEELSATEGDGPSLAEHMTHALRLVGLELVLGGEAEESLRADLLLLLGRHQSLIPELIDDVLQFLHQLPPMDLGRELAALLFEQEREERGDLFMAITTLSTGLAVPALEAMGHRDREEVLDAVLAALERAQGEDSALQALGEVLSESVHGERFEGLFQEAGTQEQELPEDDAEDPDAARPTLEIPAISPVSSTMTLEMRIVTEEPSSPTMEFELPGQDTGEDEEEDWILPKEPEAEAVAQRALVAGRAAAAAGAGGAARAGQGPGGPGGDPAAPAVAGRRRAASSTLGVTGLELFESGARHLVRGGSAVRGLERRGAAPAAVVPEAGKAAATGGAGGCRAAAGAPAVAEGSAALPGARRAALSRRDRGPAQTAGRCCWSAPATSRSPGASLADASIAEGDPELDGLLDSAEAEGFDRARLENEARQGPGRGGGAALLVALPRHPAPEGGAAARQARRRAPLPGQAPARTWTRTGLAPLLALAHGRSQALGWLVEGGWRSPRRRRRARVKPGPRREAQAGRAQMFQSRRSMTSLPAGGGLELQIRLRAGHQRAQQLPALVARRGLHAEERRVRMRHAPLGRLRLLLDLREDARLEVVERARRLSPWRTGSSARGSPAARGRSRPPRPAAAARASPAPSRPRCSPARPSDRASGATPTARRTPPRARGAPAAPRPPSSMVAPSGVDGQLLQLRLEQPDVAADALLELLQRAGPQLLLEGRQELARRSPRDPDPCGARPPCARRGGPLSLASLSSGLFASTSVAASTSACPLGTPFWNSSSSAEASPSGAVMRSSRQNAAASLRKARSTSARSTSSSSFHCSTEGAPGARGIQLIHAPARPGRQRQQPPRALLALARLPRLARLAQRVPAPLLGREELRVAHQHHLAPREQRHGGQLLRHLARRGRVQHREVQPHGGIRHERLHQLVGALAHQVLLAPEQVQRRHLPRLHLRQHLVHLRAHRTSRISISSSIRSSWSLGEPLRPLIAARARSMSWCRRCSSDS